MAAGEAAFLIRDGWLPEVHPGGLPRGRWARAAGYGSAVPRFRLITGAGVVLETFESDSGEAAVEYGRQLARTRMVNTGQARLAQTVARAGFAVERQTDDGWSFVRAWVPSADRPAGVRAA